MRRARKPTNPQVGKYTGDNFVLVPASLLPFKDQWQRLLDGTPPRGVLFIVPEGETTLRQTMRQLVPELRASGRHVTALPAARFR